MSRSVVADRICETATTAGNGDFTLDGAITGYQAFFDWMDVGDDCYYLIEAVDASNAPTGEWETGIGTLTGATTLERTQVLDNSTGSSTALVVFAAGTKRVHMVANAQMLRHTGVLVRMAADLTGQDLTTAGALSWDTDALASFGPYWHDVSTDPSRITVPATAGQRHVRLSGQVGFDNVTTLETIALTIRINGSATTFGVGRNVASTPSTSPVYQVTTPILAAEPGDYYELFVQVGADISVDIVAVQSWFQIEVLQ